MTAYLNITGSGYLNNPIRTIVIDNDNRPGTYPTHTSPVQQMLPESMDLMRPYRDDLTVETPVAYAQARASLSRIPNPNDTVNLVNASGVTHQFVFKSISEPDPSATVHNVGMDGVVASERSALYPGLTPAQITIANVTDRLIDAINEATGSLIAARPGRTVGEVILEQRIPGTVGNQANSTTSTFVTVTNFTGGRNSEVRYPYGFYVGDGDPALTTNELVRRAVRGTRSGTLDVPTSGRAGLLDAPSDGHPYVAHSPFNETGAYQAFGIAGGGSELYGTQGGLEGEFFTRGSVSGSLDEPLGVKDKIEIDLTPVAETTLLHSGGFPNHPMAYFSFETRRWEPIGFGSGSASPLPAPTSLQDLLETQYLGFSQGWGNLYTPSSILNVSITDPQLADQYTGTKNVFQETGWFTPIDTFGFPLHPKYYATGSQQLDCTQLVDRPFLLEKVVYEFSASMPNLSSRIIFDEYRGSGGAFFILNQRKANPDPGQENSYTNVYVARTVSPIQFFSTPQDGGTNGPAGDFWTIPYDNGGIPRTMQLSPMGPNVYVDAVRDLVTFARIGTVWSTYDEEIENLIEPGFPHPATFMDLAIEVPVSGTFSGAFTVAAPILAPSQNSAVSVIDLGASLSPNNIAQIYASKDTSTRNSIDTATGRAHNGEFFGPETSYRVEAFGVINKQLFAPKTDSISSPYLIKPGDRLVFGWQAPTYYLLNSTNVDPPPTLKLLPGKGKLTLYGSYLQDDKPVHDIFKDQLNSDAAHETIPSGPWVLDRFESEPQMVYSSSMREEHVTGTMLTRRSDGSLVVTSVGDLGIGGARAVSARASDGDLRQRWSFFRNSRLFDSEEQYYDSMQPNPVDTLFSDPDVRALGGVAAGYVPLMLPGENYIGPASTPNTNAALNTYSNRSFFTRYPFQQEYENIFRVKKINSRVLTGKNVPSFLPSGGDTVLLSTTVINSAIFFVTGWTGTPGPTTFSNYSRPGGIWATQPTSTTFNQGLIFPLTSRRDDETNPTRGNFLPADARVDDVTAEVNYWVSRFMGCFGDGFLRMCQFKHVFGASSDAVSFQVLDYRGTKHGLINPTPLFSNAVFNGTQFGQLRDMMEQRQYTRFSLNDSSLTDSAVGVVFIDRSVLPDINGSITNNVTSGSATNSSNISPFATSEHPYDDALADGGLIWDRNTPLPEESIAL